jgi:uncharacterized RDD family membrane protein YckC
VSTAEEFLDIGTPENVVFGYEVAGIGSRFLAALVDTALIGLLLLITNFVLLVVASAAGQSPGTGDDAARWFIAFLGLISFLILWGYYIFFELFWNGQSPGKRLVGLRVIRGDGSPIGLVESIVRNLIRIIDFLPLYYGIGVVAMFVSRRAQRLGDLAAGTLVVYDRGMVTLESLAHGPAAAWTSATAPPEGPLAHLPLERLRPADVALAERFLQRRGQLINQRQLADELAGGLLARMEVPAEQALQFSAIDLLRVVAASRGGR